MSDKVAGIVQTLLELRDDWAVCKAGDDLAAVEGRESVCGMAMQALDRHLPSDSPLWPLIRAIDFRPAS